MKQNFPLLAGFLVNLICYGQIIHVPADQPTIQEEIDVVADGNFTKML
jgi:hypothetical protein